MRLTIRDIQKMKMQGEPIVMLTAYDATSAYIAESADVPMILVGDSVGTTVQGHDSTIPVTLDQMIYHASIVTRVTKRALIVGDLPFMSYNVSAEQALTSAGKMMQQGGVSTVKLEGGEYIAATVHHIVQSGIPVMGHIGLTPQSVNQFGGFRVQGKEIDSARRLLHDAEALQDAGAFAIVLELVPSELAQMITEHLHIPTIGIGAGPHCSGQVQVFHDLLGLYPSFGPRHARKYADVGAVMQDAISRFVQDVKQGSFPTAEQSSSMKNEVAEALRLEAQVNSAGH
jgi:3-methyl-2-oxobutanoate hydroxymethyltransferase